MLIVAHNPALIPAYGNRKPAYGSGMQQNERSLLTRHLCTERAACHPARPNFMENLLLITV